MRRVWFVIIMTCLMLGAGVVEERRIDLSYFLSPYNQINIIVPDCRGDIFVTQLDRQEFIKITEDGRFAGAAPLLREGRIKSLDITQEGDVVVLFVRTPGLLRILKSAWAVVFYDGRSLRKKRELPFAKLAAAFEQIREVKVLKPDNKLLIKGKRKGRGALLHIIDYDGNILKSFSICDTVIHDPIEREMDCFSEGYVKIDSVNRIIYQIFPISGVIEAYSYEGEFLGKGTINPIEYKVEVFPSKLLLQDFFIEEESTILKEMHIIGDRLVISERGIKVPHNYGNLVASCKDKLYFLGGDSGKELVICKLE